MIEVAVNGKKWEVPKQARVGDLLSRLKISPQVCVVEVNGEIVERKNYKKKILLNEDKIEIIRMMAGG